MNVVTNNKWIGQRTIRPDGVDKVTGRAVYGAEFVEALSAAPSSAFVALGSPITVRRGDRIA